LLFPSFPSEEQSPQWTQDRFLGAAFLPPILPGSRIQSITVILDEGTDRPAYKGERHCSQIVVVLICNRTDRQNQSDANCKKANDKNPLRHAGLRPRERAGSGAGSPLVPQARTRWDARGVRRA